MHMRAPWVRWFLGAAVALVAAEAETRAEPCWVACGPHHCDARTSYCEIFLSDVANPPTDYFCRPLPSSCLPGADGAARGCECFPAGTRCGAFCGPLPTAGGALSGFHLTCQGKRPPPD